MSVGIGGHHRARGATDEWLTPPQIIRALGQFDLDPCSPVDRPWDTATKHYSIRENGLAQVWNDRVWLNPPYGNQTGLWLRKLAHHGNGIALIFARTETTWFHAYGWEMASGFLFIKGRLNFHRADGIRAERNAGGPSVLIAYGEQNVESLRRSGIAGRIVA